MCGIIGYVGYRQASPIAFEALRRLEYRGYDSAGIAVAGENGIKVKKDAGRVDDINNKVDFLSLSGVYGIGHTRWATHGGVTKKNAHPHWSNNKKIYVIHNGIVENYQEIRKYLRSQGYTFYSATDTEVIPNLIEFEMKKGKSFEKASMDAINQLEGYYAVLVMYEGEKKIIGSRNGSPLVVGIGENENFIASDIPAFLEFTKKVMYIHDHDFVVIDGETNQVRFSSVYTGEPLSRPVHSIDWDLEQAQKGNFDHFMMKEITEQVHTVKAAQNQDLRLC